MITGYLFSHFKWLVVTLSLSKPSETLALYTTATQQTCMNSAKDFICLLNCWTICWMQMWPGKQCNHCICRQRALILFCRRQMVQNKTQNPVSHVIPSMNTHQIQTACVTLQQLGRAPCEPPFFFFFISRLRHKTGSWCSDLTLWMFQ